MAPPEGGRNEAVPRKLRLAGGRAELDADGIGLAGITPSGITADVRDYVLEGAGSEWRVIHWKRIGFVE